MNILIVGNILRDTYLNLNTRTEKLETDRNNVKWLDFSFDASEHHFFSQNISLGGAAVSLEVFQKMGLSASISNTDLSFLNDDNTKVSDNITSRYILIADETASYIVPDRLKPSVFTPPASKIDYLYIDRSANLDSENTVKILNYLQENQDTKLVLYLKDSENAYFKKLLPLANLVFSESPLENADPKKTIFISEKQISYLNIEEKLSLKRANIMTHLSAYSIISATILSCFILGQSAEESLKMACKNAENSKLDASLSLEELKSLSSKTTSKTNELRFIAASLVLPKKGILAADESGGSIKKKFAKLNIPDTYENRRDYRNIFFTTPTLEQYVNGVILFDETARQTADDGRNFVDYLTSLRIIPGIKVDEGLEKFENSEETYTKGLENLSKKLPEYYNMGLRFAKWRAAFEIRLNNNGEILTPTDHAVNENCRILAEYAKKCQAAGIVPIVEPEVVYDGYYDIDKSVFVTSRILSRLFEELKHQDVALDSCLLKVNMILAGKQFETQSTPKEVGQKTAEVLKSHVPKELAGVVFLSGGQTVEQATDNLAEIEKNGPFPWPVTFSFARALQDPALYAWEGNPENENLARASFLARLIANCKVLP